MGQSGGRRRPLGEREWGGVRGGWKGNLSRSSSALHPFPFLPPLTSPTPPFPLSLRCLWGLPTAEPISHYFRLHFSRLRLAKMFSRLSHAVAGIAQRPFESLPLTCSVWMEGRSGLSQAALLSACFQRRTGQ